MCRCPLCSVGKGKRSSSGKGGYVNRPLSRLCSTVPVPPPLKDLAAIRLYGSFLHGLVRLKSERGQAFTTSFFRNRPQLQLISRLADKKATGSTLRMAILGCSNGAEVYSILWTIRSRRPDLKVISHAVDISKDILESAQT